MKLKMFDIFERVPKGAKVYIYGFGTEGKMAQKLMLHQRPDIQFLGFIDSFNYGNIDGFKVNSAVILQEKIEYDYVLVASKATYEITRNLTALNVEKHLILDSMALGKLHCHYYGATSVGRPLEENRIKYEQNIEKIEKAKSLFDKETRIYYENLIKERFDEKVFLEFSQEYLKTPGRISCQYFDYINKEAIKTIIEGGIFDGLSSVSFLNHLPNLKNLYGFEPLYDKFKQDPFKTIIEKTPKITMYAQGLWDKKDVLTIQDQGLGTSFCNENNENGEFYDIEVVTIDDFVKENNIPKIDFLKLDVEGAEMNVLQGGKETFVKDRPQFAISIYHSFEDLYEIPLLFDELLENYTYKIGHYEPGIWDAVLYCIPNELSV